MEILSIKNLTFSYPENERKTLNNVSLSINKGDFVVLCGKSGSGKTTLLRHFKPAITPHGDREGEVLFYGNDIGKTDEREQCQKIGYVQQRPENQIVTDKVWHELAFGLENLGYDTVQMRAKVAEMASFFGIQNWFHKDVSELSGGQKQLLNLASVMVMQPDVIILDEPTAQLDPITAVNFLETVAKINRELGTTVILTEHRLEEVFPMADHVIVMENGEIAAQGTPKEVGVNLVDGEMFEALPTPMHVFLGVKGEGECPVTIRDGRKWLESCKFNESECAPDTEESADTLIELKNVWFKYEKDETDVLKGVDVKIPEGKIYALVGGNGTGKTTVLSVLGGLLKPYRGKVLYKGKKIEKNVTFRNSVAVLPQDPQCLFSKNNCLAELEEMTDSDIAIKDVAEKCDIAHILNSHPYDLSGGEQQRLALAKILLMMNTEILLLDEPTKGFDSHFKKQFAKILEELKNKNITIIMVSHDIEFCARYADRCAMFFDGVITSEDTAKNFFAGKSFYTTAANRMARNIIDNVVLAEEIIKALEDKTQ